MSIEMVRDFVDRHTNGYGRDDPAVIVGYVQTAGLYGVGVGTLVGIGRLLGRRPPERLGASDLALVTVAAHKLSRVISKEAIATPLRAPFTRFVEPTGASEVAEEVRGHGLRHSIGELLTCPFCLDLWASTALVAGLVLAPRATRLAASVLAATAGSDVLQFAYDAMKRS